jgi:hypothetical protein
LYLHDRAPFQIVYREFRSSSVLLDKDYTPRLAGYGLAVTSSPSDKRSSFTSVRSLVNPLITVRSPIPLT